MAVWNASVTADVVVVYVKRVGRSSVGDVYHFKIGGVFGRLQSVVLLRKPSARKVNPVSAPVILQASWL